MIKIKQLSRAFGDFKAVDNISFEVKPGEVLGFLGPNGAGKSTTMKMLTGFLGISGGSVSIMGHDIQTQSLEARKVIGYLPEGAPSYGEMTVQAYLNFIAEVRGLRGDKLTQAVNSAISKLALEKVILQEIDTLSKGFTRRVGLAQAILHDPQVLILDEPTDGLDPNQKHQVRELIRNLSQDKIVIISTHLLEEVTAVCTRAMILSAGQIVFNGTPDELAKKSRYHNAVRIRFSRWNPQYEGLIRALDCVSNIHLPSIEDEENADLVTLFSKDGESILQPVNALIQQQGWEIEEINVESGRLDDVFRQITEGEAA
jgi:ABC-2 type transport system ATP-binding protein